MSDEVKIPGVQVQISKTIDDSTCYAFGIHEFKFIADHYPDGTVVLLVSNGELNGASHLWELTPPPNLENERAKFVAKKLAARLETLINGGKINGAFPLDNSTWCKNSEKLIERAKEL